MNSILFQQSKTICGRFESGEIFGIGHGYEPINSSQVTVMSTVKNGECKVEM